MKTMGKLGIKLMKIPGWQQVMLTTGTALLGYVVKRVSKGISSRAKFKNNMERINALRSDELISEEEYEILRRNLVEKDYK